MAKRKQNKKAAIAVPDYSHEIDTQIRLKQEQELPSLVHEFNVDPRLGHIYLMGEEIETADGEEPGVEYRLANRFVRNMNLIMRDASIEAVLIHMKTCGGSWDEGMAIHNLIEACPKPVTILNYTHARSMSSIILQAADKRVMMADSYFMAHRGDLSVSATIPEVYTDVDFAKKACDRMFEVYVDALRRTPTGKFYQKSRASIEKHLRDIIAARGALYLTAKETVEYGFADEVFGTGGYYRWDQLLKYTDAQLER